ncbi:hypothetical protein [Caballeronia sp. SBC2]
MHGERRVAVTPETVKKFLARGHKVATRCSLSRVRLLAVRVPS